jgi:hypothetical protein
VRDALTQDWVKRPDREIAKGPANGRGFCLAESFERSECFFAIADVLEQGEADILDVPAIVVGSEVAGFATYKRRRFKACDCADISLAAGGRSAPEEWAAWNDCPHPWVQSANVPPILAVDLWERAQRVIAARQRKHVGGRGNRGSSERFRLAGLVWCAQCGERIGARTDQRPGQSEKDRYVCRGKRVARCDLPSIPRGELDDAIRASFVSQFVDQVDIQSTVERERDRLLALRQSESQVLRDEIAHVEPEVASAHSLSVRARRDYESGAITADQWSRLDTDASGRAELGEAALDRLRDRLSQCDAGPGVAEIDALLDRLTAITRMVAGKLTAEDVSALSLQLAEVFEEFRVHRSGDRIIVEPKLRSGFLPEGDWTTLDFGGDQAGVEIVDYLDPVMRKVDLTRGIAADISHGSC